jgi:type I restriction enzyme S subunit
VLNGYLYQWITAEHIRDQVEALMKGATGRQRLNAEDLASAKLPVPPLDEQKRIVARLDSMRAKTSEMSAAYDAKIAAAKNLRQSILEAAFAGQL